MKKFIQLIVLSISFVVSMQASAKPVLSTDNGHYYEAFDDLSAMTWEDARDWASGLTYTDGSGQLFNGYLATITSSDEDNFIVSMNLAQTAYMLGGFQTPTTNESTQAEREADWHWVTGEEWDVTAWRIGEPNNTFRMPGQTEYSESEQYLQYITGTSNGVWNDVYTGTYKDEEGGEEFFGQTNFIVEYEAVSVVEPASLALMALGLAGIGYRRKIAT